MSISIVISQSMYFPWVGMLEQVKLADIFVHYDDVQFSRGSFTNRVQVKSQKGIRWLTIPIAKRKLSQRIDEVDIDNRVDWRHRHYELLRQVFQKTPYRRDALAIVESVFDHQYVKLSEVARASMMALIDYFKLREKKVFIDSKVLGIGGSSSKRVHDIVCSLSGNIYITGHGAKNYLDHKLFDKSGIEVRYMDYQCREYPQPFGSFSPYVSGLDLIANCGFEGSSFIQSKSIYWKEFINEFQ